MSDRFAAALAAHGGAVSGRVAQPRWGTVQSVNPATMSAKVLIQPEGVLTGWLPVVSPAVGGAYIIAPLTQGQQVFMAPDAGDADSYVILGVGFNNLAQAPQVPAAVAGAATQVKPGEIALVDAAGGVLRVAGGNVFVKGNLVVDGNVSDRHGSLDRLRGNYNAHKHGSSPTTDHVDPE